MVVSAAKIRVLCAVLHAMEQEGTRSWAVRRSHAAPAGVQGESSAVHASRAMGGILMPYGGQWECQTDRGATGRPHEKPRRGARAARGGRGGEGGGEGDGSGRHGGEESQYSVDRPY